MTKSNSFKIQLSVFAVAVLAVTFASVTSIWFEWHSGFPSSFEDWLKFLSLWFGFILGPLGGIYLPISWLGMDAIGGFILLLPLLGMALSWVPLGVFILNKRKGPILLTISAIFWGFIPFICVGIMSI